MSQVKSNSSSPLVAVEALARRASGAGVLSPEGLRALTDGHISGDDMLMARRLVTTAMERVNASAARQKEVAPLEKELGRHQLARQLADATTSVYFEKNPPGVLGRSAELLGRMTDSAFAGMNGWILSTRKSSLQQTAPAR